MSAVREHYGSEMESFGSAAGKQVPFAMAETSIGDQMAQDDGLDQDLQAGFTANDRRDMQRMGKTQQFRVSSPWFRRDFPRSNEFDRETSG